MSQKLGVEEYKPKDKRWEDTEILIDLTNE